MIEMVFDARSICPFRSRGKPEENLRSQLIDDTIIRLGLGVMSFIQNDVVPAVEAFLLVKALGNERLHRTEDMVQGRRTLTIH